MKALVSLFFSLFITMSLLAGVGPVGSTSPAANAELSGMILDINSGEALGGVEITIEGTDLHYYTDFDGKYEIKDVMPGTYNLIVSYISYEKSLIEQVKLKPENDNTLDIRLMSTK